jgi:hypothetical protein
MFWSWLLKYSSFFITGVISFVVGYLLHRIATKNPDLIYYTTQEQWVPLPQQHGQPPQGPVGTFTLFLWNQGKAPAREVHVGHFSLPAHNVYPDVPREVVTTAGGGKAIRFPAVPPRVLISISYLYTLPIMQTTVLSYVGSEDGTAKHIPVMLQRIFPKWFNAAILVLLVAGLWVVVNATWSLIRFLWVFYYVNR